MDSQQKIQLVQKIESEISALEADIRTLESMIQPVSPDNAIGRLTRLEAIGSKSMSEAALATAKKTVATLRVKLRQADDEGFGECHECEEPIAFARLLALPHTELCIRCAN